jgi:hypothetical protein
VAKKHRVMYSAVTPIRVATLTPLLTGIANVRVLTADGKVPMDAPFALTIDLPEYEPENLYPVEKKTYLQVPSSLLVLATVYDSPTTAGVAAATKAAPGSPVNHPQRKHELKVKRTVRHQTFEFPEKLQTDRRFTFADSAMMMNRFVTLFVYSLHKFYVGQTLAGEKTILKAFQLPY